jgi:uncharacterized protein YdhG (YjbR/CyaY superfamily)
MPITVDEYLAGLPDDVRPVVEQVRAAIRRAIPYGEERVRYGMPAVMLNDRYAIHYAGWKQHIGIYPVGELPDALEPDIAPYRTKTDTVAFKYKDGVPYDLIERLAAALLARRGSADQA